MLDGKFCTPCQKKGHLCPAATFEDGVGLCAFCQDEEECPVSKREKEVAARFGKAAAGRAAAVAPAKEKVLRGTKEVKEEKTMDEKKQCACGCGKNLRRDNSTGYFTGHKPTDGVGRGNGRKASDEVGTEAVPPRKPVSKPAKNWEQFQLRKNGERNGAAAAKPPKNVKGIATLYVPEQALDRFWAGRSVIEKAQIFSEWLANS